MHGVSTSGAGLLSPEGLRVLVVGLGRFGGGVGVTQWLASEGATVTVTDLASERELEESVKAIANLPVTLHLGGHDPRDLDAIDLIIINPAVDKTRSAFFEAIVARGLAWTTEINLFCERCPAGIIAVTGSYGKSTTCAMLATALRAAGDANVYLGGNIGCSLLPDLPKMRRSDVVVLEISNAQLEDLPRIGWAPPMAVITNLFPHHLDRYPTFAAYAGAKLNIVRDPLKESKVIIGDIHPEVETMLDDLLPDRATESQPQDSRSRGLQPARIFEGRDLGMGSKRKWHVKQPDPPVVLRVPGGHNRANAACALTVCECLGLDEIVVREALQSFDGLPHRLQHVRTLDGVDYFNDSKATSPDAIMAALESFGRPIVAIVGGQCKDVPLAGCAKALSRACRAVICTGESGPMFANAVRRVGTAHQRPAQSGKSLSPNRLTGAADRLGSRSHRGLGIGSKSSVIVHETGSLEEAVRIAQADAKVGDVVLFSPGAPSFDAYPNFVVRGQRFIDLVKTL